MPRTNSEIDQLNILRKVNGEEPLPYETEETDEQAKAELEKQKEIDAKKEEDTKGEQKEEVKKEEKKEEVAEPEIDEAKILAYLKNKKGKDISSLDDLINPKVEPTEEDKKKAKDQREAAKISYGLTNGLFTKDELEEFITDSKNPSATVFAAYAANQKDLDPTLTDDDIKEEFENEFGLNSDKDSRTYKKGQALLNNLADNLIRKKHEKILNLEDKYAAYENSSTQAKEIENKTKTQLPLYTAALNKIGKDLKKVSIPISDSENFETELEDADVNEIVSLMADDKYAQGQISKGWTEDSLKQLADTTKILKNLPRILEKYADKVLLDHQAGLRGVKPDGKRSGKENTVELTEDQKKALAFMKEQLVAN